MLVFDMYCHSKENSLKLVKIPIAKIPCTLHLQNKVYTLKAIIQHENI